MGLGRDAFSKSSNPIGRPQSPSKSPFSAQASLCGALGRDAFSKSSTQGSPPRKIFGKCFTANCGNDMTVAIAEI